jgi:hypothetical protein
MTKSKKVTFVHAAFSDNMGGGHEKILWSGHAAMRLLRLSWSREEIEHAFAKCEVVEDYPEEHRALPDCLILGFVKGKHPVHAVVALDYERGRVLVVTVYKPDRSRWKDDWKTRR